MLWGAVSICRGGWLSYVDDLYLGRICVTKGCWSPSNVRFVAASGERQERANCRDSDCTSETAGSADKIDIDTRTATLQCTC